MKILINTLTSKKQSGGAFQISQNFMLKTLEHPELEWFYMVSEDIDKDLNRFFSTIRNTRYFVFPTQPDFKKSYLKVKGQIKELESVINPDVVYSITAPSYFSFDAPEVMRFTNPWVTHPNKYAWGVLPFRDKVHYFLYGLNQKRLMRKAHFFITQTETCALGIRQITKEPENHIKVVSNVLPAVFKSISKQPIIKDGFVNIACVGAATKHKNFDIIPDVIYNLHKKGVDNVRIHTTLPEDNAILKYIKNRLSVYFLNDRVINHGRLSQQELGEMYKKCQLCFLPTLLEVFSASTLEAMYFKLPIVATDFDFNKDVLQDAALYYTPKNSRQAAERIMDYLENAALQEQMKEKMSKRLELFSDYDNHFNEIVDFLIYVGKTEKQTNYV